MKTRHYVLFAILALFCLLLIGASMWMRPYDLDKERAAASSAGIPLSEAEFPQPAPPPDEDAMPVYEGLGNLLKAKPVDFKRFEASSPNTAPPEVKTADLRVLITSRQDVARIVHDAASRPHAYVKIDWTPDQLFPQFGSMREAVKWIRLESELLVKEGKYTEAVKNEALALQIANHASEEPILIAHLVSIACEAIAMQGYADILHEAGLKPGVADAVLREIAAYKTNRDLTRCLEGEMMFGVKTLHSINSLSDMRALASNDSGDSTWKPSAYRPNSLTRSIFLDPSEAVYIHWMGKFVAASKGPMLQRNAAMAKVQREFDGAPRRRPTYVFTAMMMPVFGKVGERDVTAAARREVVSSAAAAMAFRTRTGRYPDALANSVTPAPLNPYTQKAMGYRRDAGGFVVWSVPDVTGLDNKAAAQLRKNLTFQYPAPPEPKAPVRRSRPRRGVIAGPPPMPVRSQMGGGPPMPNGR